MVTATTSLSEADVSRLSPLTNLNGSLSDRVYTAVKSAILELDFQPGAVIRKRAVCEQLGVSRSPVSEALTKLSNDGLVDIVPQSGTRVARLSMTAIREDTFLREGLEVAAARHAALHRTEEAVARLARNIEMQRLLVIDVDKEDFHGTDNDFHTTIMAATGVKRLPAAVRGLSPHIERARLLLMPEPGRLAETLDEHIAVFEAIRDRDAETAQDAMRHHLRQLLRRLEPLEAARPEMFLT